MYDLPEGLSKKELAVHSRQLLSLGERINIPGATKPELIRPVEMSGRNSRVVVSPVGACTLSYAVSGKDVFPKGTAPFAMPVLVDGKVSYEPPPFIRNVDHSPLGQTNVDEETDVSVKEAIMSLTGRSIEKYMFWHHSGHQVAIYDTYEGIDSETANRVVIFQRDFEPVEWHPANSPWRFRHIKTVMLDGDDLVETQIIQNLSDSVIVTSHTSHTYLNIDGGDSAFRGSSIYSGKEGNTRRIYELKNYKEKDVKYEKHIRPLDPYVVLLTPDREVKMFFSGDYETEKSGLQIFSPWPTMENFYRESVFINELDHSRWQKSLAFASRLGINEFSGTEATVGEQGLSVCIEPQTSGGLVYRKEDGFARAVILEPFGKSGDSKTYSRRIRVNYT